MTSSSSSSPRFYLLAIIFRTTLKKITYRRFQLHLQKAPLCSGNSFHLFIFTYSQLSQYRRPSARSKSLSPCSVKTPQYRVCKRVHEGKPRVTNRSRVNPITVQCKVGNCHSSWIAYHMLCCSPSGKLVQIEYALNAVTAGSPSVGIKAQNGVVIATEKKQKSILYDENSIHKVEPITEQIGMVYSGMGPDYRFEFYSNSTLHFKLNKLECLFSALLSLPFVSHVLRLFNSVIMQPTNDLA